MVSEHSIPNVPEEVLSDRPVLTDNLDDPVTIRRVVLDDGSKLYSVESDQKLGRAAIDQIMRRPLNEPEHGWREVRNTLQSIGRDSRKMQRFGQRAHLADQLASIRGAAAQLADTLTRNQSEHVTSAILPVATYGDSRWLTREHLMQMDSHKLLGRLRSFGYDISKAGHFSRLIGPYTGSSPFSPDAIEQLGPAMASLEREIVNGAIMEEAPHPVLDMFLTHEHYALFDGFIIKDSQPPDDRYIAKTDMPPTVNSDSVTGISVGVQHAMPTRDGRERSYVRIYSRQTPVFARPRLSWRLYPDGTRSLRFPVSGFDQPIVGEEYVTRPSSLIAAALLAGVFGKNIPYEPFVSRVLLSSGMNRSQLGEAGLWAIAAGFEDDQLTGSEYCQNAEDVF